MVVEAGAAEQLALGDVVLVDAVQAAELAREQWRRLVLDSTSPRANNLRSAIEHLAKGRGGD